MSIFGFKMFTFIIICTCIQLLLSSEKFLMYFKYYIYLHLRYIAKSLSTIALSGPLYCSIFFVIPVARACAYYWLSLVEHLTISFLPIVYIWRCSTYCCFLFLMVAVPYDSFYYFNFLLNCCVNLFING